MMTHEEASELLAVFALDAVDSDEHEQIEAHLAECPRCRAELDAHREVAAALGNSVEPLPEGLWSSIASRLPPRPTKSRRRCRPSCATARPVRAEERSAPRTFRTPRTSAAVAPPGFPGSPALGGLHRRRRRRRGGRPGREPGP